MTKPLRIDQITAKHLRGATQETAIILPPHPIILLFGENGTGKSTLIDAVDLVCCESFGSLAEISGSLKSSLPSLGASHSDVEAAVRCGSETWTARLKGKTNVVVTPPEGRPKVTVLRRTNVQRLVTASPSGRFETLKDSIDVGGLDQAEGELAKAIKRVNGYAETAARARADQETRIAGLFEQEKRPDEGKLEPVDWLRRRASVDHSSAKREKDSFQSVGQAYAELQRLAGEAAGGMKAVAEKRKEEKTANESLQKLVLGNPQATCVLNEILTETLRYLEFEPQAEACPVCERPIEATELRSRIAERLKSHPELQDKLNALQNAKTARENEEVLQKQRYLSLVKSAAILVGSLDRLPPPFVEEAGIQAAGFPLLLAWKAGTPYEKEVQRRQIAEAEAAAQRFKELADKWNARRAQLEGEIGAIESKKALLKNHEQATLDEKRWERVREKLDTVLPIISNARKQYVQRVLDCLAGDCDRIYQTIHPNEQLCGIRFMLDEEKKGSLEQFADFKGYKDVKPQACFSDSHLDTLSFSFFLALARRGDPSNTILVMDDILTSEDDQHLFNIATLLADEARNFAQIIVATHLRIWQEWIRSGRLSQATYGVVELSSRWDLATGIKAQVAEMDRTG